MFLNEGSGKTKRDRELASFFVIAKIEIVRRPFLFQAYDPETPRHPGAAGRAGHLANLVYGVRFPLLGVCLPLLGVRLSLFGVGGTPTTLWRSPYSRDVEVAARPPPKSFPRMEERVPARYFPLVRCRAERIGEG